MKQILYMFTLSIFLLMGCDRRKDSLAGRNTYAVKVRLADTLGGNKTGKETDSVIKVYLYDSVASPNIFLYTKTTANKGVAILDFLKDDTRYRITGSLSVGSVKYNGDTAFTSIKNGDRDYLINIVEDTILLTLYADITDRNLLKVLVQGDGRPVANARVCIFASQTLFNTGNCYNANYTSLTNSGGKCDMANLGPGHYYILAQKATDTIPGSPVLTGIDSFIINNGEVKPLTISIN